MTAADTDLGTGLGVHVVYPSLVYEVHRMSEYFAALGAVWDSCLQLALLRYRRRSASRALTEAEPWLESQRRAPDVTELDPIRLGQLTQRWEKDATARITFRVHRLHIASPMEITFAVEGGVAAVAVYTAFLTARVLRDPERIGAWLPRLVAGWHQGMQEAERRKLERRAVDQEQPDEAMSERRVVEQLPQVRELIKASSRVSQLHMHPEEVSVIGAHEAPEDLAAADDSDQS